MGLLLRKRKWENKILLKLVDGDGWLSRVPEISMDKESAVVHAVKAGGTVLHWVRKALCPQYSWEILCAANAGESCRTWSWVNYWGKGKEKPKAFWNLLTRMAWLCTYDQYGQGICRGSCSESRWNCFALREERMMSTIILRNPVCRECWRVLGDPDRVDRSMEEDLDKGYPCC